MPGLSAPGIVSAPRIGISGSRRTAGGVERQGVNSAYVASVLAAGGIPLVLPPAIGAPYAASVMPAIDGLVLSGGDDIDPSLYGHERHPLLGPVDLHRDMFELALFAMARQRGMPILGICRGFQLINVGLGGTLWQDLPSERPGTVNHDPKRARSDRTHDVRLEPSSVTAAALGATSLNVNSFHHQGVRDLAGGVTATAWSADGLVEAFEQADDGWIVAVQWHPEEMYREEGAPDLGLFRSLVAEAVRAPEKTPAR